MSLRSIRRKREGSGGFDWSSLNPFGGRRHFSKLSRSGNGVGSKARKDALPLIIIAAIAITIIAVEIALWSGQGGTPEPEDNVTNATDTGGEPPVQDEPPEEEPMPDLDVRSFDLGAERIFAGETLTATATVRNRGDVNVTNVSISLMVGSSVVGTKVLDMAIDENLELQFNWTPDNEQVGEQTLRVVLDPDGELEESNENNNEEEDEIEVEEKVVEDISDQFELQSTANFNIHWYSDKFKVPPQGGEDYTYFELTRVDTETYYLDLVVPGFRATKSNQIYGIEIPDPSDSGWNGRRCIKRTLGSEDCIWNGPQIKITLDFDGSRLVAEDAAGQESRATTSDNDIEEITLQGIKTARWPEENFRTWKGYNAPEPDSLIPLEFYEVDGHTIYIHPMRWNPRQLRAEVTTWLRFRITTD